MADCTCLENRRPLTGSVGSNPTSSDFFSKKMEERKANCLAFRGKDCSGSKGRFGPVRGDPTSSDFSSDPDLQRNQGTLLFHDLKRFCICFFMDDVVHACSRVSIWIIVYFIAFVF